ncbi:glycosyltransferase involved in cell wall biosynthesis [Paenibacillus shirakamiensis]|uniref:Glycosyltransferase involved in cell wall biosynthesis n=1 Tax=Paenibacillus shirakamiensis TaxID=1265935 RepID=A0ABS4JKB4_9BACL|nr:glycosyltransferase [Paenibacillus shirakamiensis]MBP2002149.1 glycosyltransferase involved in cell wall biosynthesis [Paenibacillus shirakamiensis]
MRILFTFYIPSGGVETLNRIRCHTLRQYGVEGHLLYTAAGSGLQNITDIPTYVMHTDEEIAYLLSIQHFDAIIVTSDFPMTKRLRQLGYPGPILFEAQGFGTLEDAQVIILDAAKDLQAYTQGVVLPPTTHLLHLFSQICPWLQQFVIMNMLDTSMFYHRSVEVPNHPVVAWVGRIEANKNWNEFLLIGKRLQQLRPNVELRMYTDATLAQPKEHQRFQEQLDVLDLSNTITMISNVPHTHMPHQYSVIADSGGFLLSTSIIEGFGYAVGEAMACRCPVLSTDSDGVRAFITHDQTGKFYDIGNIEQAAHLGLELIDNIPLRNHICAQGEQRIQESFSPHQYAIQFIKMMHALSVG